MKHRLSLLTILLVLGCDGVQQNVEKPNAETVPADNTKRELANFTEGSSKPMITALPKRQGNPSHGGPLVPHHAKAIARVERLLRAVKKYHDRADHDRAIKYCDAVLEVDPYNVAARRWLEAISARPQEAP